MKDKTFTLSSDDLKVLNFTLSLQDRCMALAEALAAEINGDLSYVPEEDAERIMANLTPDNIQETAEELAQLAYWFN